MLKLINIKKSFSKKPVLQGINCEIKNGSLAALIGPNGAGKSTLFHLITGEIKPDEGSIYLAGHVISEAPKIARAQQIALVRQDPKTATAPSLTVGENMALALLKNKQASLKKALSKANKQKILEHLLSLKIDPEILHQEMGSLSGGQRQMLAFAMATLYPPKLLLLDEPTAALDEPTTIKLMELIKGFIKEWQIPAIMICHDNTVVTRFADEVFQLKDGVIGDTPFA
jgi:putative ABC transport system ATP-binding protein